VNLSLYEGLAKKWMLGHRQGAPGMAPREAWRHPEDLVRLIDEWPMPSGWNKNVRTYLKCVAWLHDLLEDGVKDDGAQVTEQDLRDAGAEWAIVRDVVSLSILPGEEKTAYLERLVKASWAAQLAKCFDRICNLREGKDVFKDHRWERYTHETQVYILPIAHRLDPWLFDELQKALEARPVSTEG
jgi:(p)ppGpp synthase/HD superfamily hydrolase